MPDISNIDRDYAAETIDQLSRDYGHFEAAVTEVLDQARTLPATVEDDETQGRYAATIKSLRDLNDRIEGVRISEKEPHLRRGNAVDSWFGAMKAKLVRKQKNDKAGAADVLQARVNDYVNRKAAEERRRRDEEARLAREAEDKARREREAAERAAAEAAAKAARARKPENVEKTQQEAAERAAEAARLRDEESRAKEQRQDATADASAKTADLVRTRTDSGHLVTAKREPHVEIIDGMKLDAVALWAFVKDDHKLAALKAWAKITQHKKQMDGAIIEMRDVAVIR